MPSHTPTLCVARETSPSLASSFLDLDETLVCPDQRSIFSRGCFSDNGVSVRGLRSSPFFPTITMLDHRSSNGGALAFQGASIKEGKKSCSQRGEIHFVPGSNICCSHPSQKDARIKPKSPLIYCNDRQRDRQKG